MNSELRDIAYSKEERIKKLEEQLSRVAKHVIELEEENSQLIEKTEQLEDKLEELKTGSKSEIKEPDEVELIPEDTLDENQQDFSDLNLEQEEKQEQTEKEKTGSEMIDEAKEEFEQEEPQSQSQEEGTDEETGNDDETYSHALRKDGLAGRKEYKNAFIKTLEKEGKPLTITEIAEKSFRDRDEVKSQDRIYHYSASILRELVDEGDVKKEENGLPYRYFLSSNDSHVTDSIPQEIRNLKDAETIEPDEIEPDERFFQGLKELAEHDEPLSRNEIIQLVYKFSSNQEDISLDSGTSYKNKFRSVFRKMERKNVVERTDEGRAQNHGVYYQINDRGRELVESLRGNRQEAETESYEAAKRNAGVSDRDAEIVENALKTLLIDKQQEFVSYHSFEANYAGEMNPIDMFQKLFSNPALLSHINERVMPNNTLKWEKKKQGKYDTGVRNWVITYE